MSGEAQRSDSPSWRAIFVVAFAALMVCASADAEHRASKPGPGRYVASEYAPFDTAGTASIGGTGSASPVKGVHLTIATHAVELTPVTTWSELWWDRWVLRGYALENSDPRASRYIRVVTADSVGHFRFENLAAGQYYLRSSLLWWSGISGRDGAATAFVVMGKQVTVAPGQHAEITLDSLRNDVDLAQYPSYPPYLWDFGTDGWGVPPEPR